MRRPAFLALACLAPCVPTLLLFRLAVSIVALRFEDDDDAFASRAVLVVTFGYLAASTVEELQVRRRL